MSLMERLLPPICVALQHSREYHTVKAPVVLQPPPQAAVADITMEDLDRTIGLEEPGHERIPGEKVVKASVSAVHYYLGLHYCNQ